MLSRGSDSGRARTIRDGGQAPGRRGGAGRYGDAAGGIGGRRLERSWRAVIALSARGLAGVDASRFRSGSDWGGNRASLAGGVEDGFGFGGDTGLDEIIVGLGADDLIGNTKEIGVFLELGLTLLVLEIGGETAFGDVGLGGEAVGTRETQDRFRRCRFIGEHDVEKLLGDQAGHGVAEIGIVGQHQFGQVELVGACP
jgi:hypothetical protein